MTEHDPFNRLLHEWRAPDLASSLEDRTVEAYRTEFSSSNQPPFFSALVDSTSEHTGAANGPRDPPCRHALLVPLKICPQSSNGHGGRGYACECHRV